jgi:hypothetical protein
MRTPFVLSSLVVLAFGASAAVKRHDHGAERNAPSARSMPCAPAEAASGAKAKARTKPVHDHAKFHKNQ